MKTIEFSVLICTYNRHELLRSALRSIVIDALEKPDELVVVNGGDERTDQVVREFQNVNEVDVRLVKTVNKNLATSRNIGLENCRGNIVAMTDDDAEVFPDWVTLMKRVHAEHPEAGAVGGLVLGSNRESLVGKIADAVTFPSWSSARSVRTLPGVNVSYKRDVLSRIGAQDVELFRGEDVDFNWRVQKEGFSIWFDPAIKVYHHHRPTVKGFFNQHYMYGRAYYLVRRKWPDMYCVYPHGIRRGRDILKAGHFFVALAYEPFVAARKLDSWKDRLRALPLLFLVGFLWKWGMVEQGMFRASSRRSRSVTPSVAGR